MTKTVAQLDAEIAEALARPRKPIPTDVRAAIEAHALEIITNMYRRHATVGGKEPCVTVSLVADFTHAFVAGRTPLIDVGDRFLQLGSPREELLHVDALQGMSDLAFELGSLRAHLRTTAKRLGPPLLVTLRIVY